MSPEQRFGSTRSGRTYTWLVLMVVVVVVAAITLIGIMKSRHDSYDLLVRQGSAFTEALAQACENTIVSESYYDRLTTDHFSDLLDDLVQGDAHHITSAALTSFANLHDLYGAYIYDSIGHLLLTSVTAGPVVRPPSDVEAVVRRLGGDLASRSTTVYVADSISGSRILYYVQITNQLDRVIVLATDPSLYDEARTRTGIGLLAQSMAEEPGIEYIVYQAKEGIIFSSVRGESFTAIESDSFLIGALDSDSIMNRRSPFQGKDVLELVRPLATRRFPFGLLRVGTSLEGYFAVSRSFDRLMFVLSTALAALLVIGVLYVSSRRERAVLTRDISEYRSTTDRIFAEISTGVVVIDPEGHVELVNRALERMLGVTMNGKDVQSMAAELPAELVEMMDRGANIEEREVRVTSNGELRILLVGRSALGERSSHQGKIVIVATDVTQLKEYEAAASRKERLSEMGHLAAAVAHEIRNPLNAISIATQRLESEITPTDHKEEFASFTGQIRSETRRLNEIITRFLSLTRSDSLKRAESDVTRVLSEFEQLVKPEASRLSITLTVTSAPDLKLAIEPARLKELLLNLYNNAKEALAGKTGRIGIQADSPGSHVRIKVSDSGPGISAELRSKVFAPYFTTKEGGTGIGLAVVHQIVEELGGSITITDSKLGGASIELMFPIKS